MENLYDIILFYKYTRIENPEALKNTQRELCEKLGLKGRVIIAREGINATLGGLASKLDKYVLSLKADPHFSGIQIKRSEGAPDAFPRLQVKVRPEIVTAKLGSDDVDPTKLIGTHLPPETLHEWIRAGKQFKIVDMRNEYEFKSGHFKNSIFSGMKHFRDLSKVVPALAHLRDETVVTVCTGGVRCEKASGYLKQKGFKDVYQLDGGILTYMEKFKNNDFLGKLYVFDSRLTMAYVSDGKRVVVGRCDKCSASSENYINCYYPTCHAHFICCESCIKKNNVYCGLKCRILQWCENFSKLNIFSKL